MNHKLVPHEQYSLIQLFEPAFDTSITVEFEELSRDLFRQSTRNIIVDLSQTRAIDVAGISVLKKINMLCSRELGILVLVSDDDDFLDILMDARIRDVVILNTVEEAIDAVFMNDLENEFTAESDDFEDDEFDPEGFIPEKAE